jgi:hypothetical protein
MNPKDTTRRLVTHPVKSSARRATRRPSYLRLHVASEATPPAEETTAGDAICRGDLAGHALSLTAREVMPLPIRVARNVLRPRARPGVFERALTNPDEGRPYLAKQLETLAVQIERVRGTLGSMNAVSVNLQDRKTWAELQAITLLIEDAESLRRMVVASLEAAA